MRSSHTIYTLAACMLCGPLYAASPARYQTHRDPAQLLSVNPALPVTSQYAGNAGKLVEIDGTVCGIITTPRTGFLLQNAAGQSFVIITAGNDPDIAIGTHLRVLAQVPESGMALQGIVVTNPDKHYRPRHHSRRLPIEHDNIVSVPDTTVTAIPQAPASGTSEHTDEASTRSADTTIASGDVPVGNIPRPARHRAHRDITSSQDAPAATPDTPATSQDMSAASPDAPPDDTAAIDPALRAKVLMYADKIRHINKNVSQATANQIAYGVLVKSPQYGVDPMLVFALIIQESRFNPLAVSRVGAQGLGQLMPETARRLGVRDAFDIYDNLDGSIRYLKQQLDRFDGNYRYALAAYNAGPGAVIKYKGIPPYAETQNYVRVISTHYESLTQQQSL